MSNPTTQVAQSAGANLVQDAYGWQAEFPAIGEEQLAAGFVSPLTDLGVIEVTGEDAAKFLHSQLTNDVEHLGVGQAHWYGYCSPKGRLLGTFLGWKTFDSRIMLVCAAPQLDALRKRLSMFVLRAKAKLVDVSMGTVLIGIGGNSAAEGLRQLGIEPPQALAAVEQAGLMCVGLPAVELAGNASGRWLLAIDADRAPQLWSQLCMTLKPTSTENWRWTEVLAAIPRIVPQTAEQFVPQMLNFEVAGGVNFKKGCYPGQEIVARSQYLGKLKRRMFLAHSNGDLPAPGSDVMPASGGEPCGQIVLAAHCPSGGIDLLFESQTSALEAGAPSAAGNTLLVRALPYSMPG